MRRKKSNVYMPDIEFAKVGQKMKELRVSQGITQEKIAKDLDTTIAYVSNVENNRTKLNLRILVYYAELCHVSVEYLLDAGREKAQKVEEDGAEKEIRRALGFYSQEEKQKFLKMLIVAKDLK